MVGCHSVMKQPDDQRNKSYSKVNFRVLGMMKAKSGAT